MSDAPNRWPWTILPCRRRRDRERCQQYPGIVIIGTGFSGLGMAIRLKQAGHHDFVILEKDEDLGGTWRDNHYPGCACDVPSHMYSFSFELNPDWSRMFSPQEEIWAYLRRCADKHDVTTHIHYGSEVERMEWDDAERRWHVTTTSGEVYMTRAIVSGIGGLMCLPSQTFQEPTGSGARHFTRRNGTSPATFQATGRGHRDRCIGDSVHPADRQAGRAGPCVPADSVMARPRPDFEFPPAVRAAFRAAPPVMRAFRDGLYWLLEAAGPVSRSTPG